MATAVETSSQPRAPVRPAGLALAAVAGAVYVLAALAVVLYAVPLLWEQYVVPALPAGLGRAPFGVRVALQVAAAVGLVRFGQGLAGPNPARGLRGGIFLVISALVTVFFLTRAFGLWLEGRVEGPTGQGVTVAVGVGLVVLFARLLASPRGARWMVALEEQGWFHLSRYKPALGQRVRRLTLLGILGVGVTGVWSMYNQGMVPENWALTLPYTSPDGSPETNRAVPVSSYPRAVVPVVLLLASAWVAFRAVNLPAFAEFLIATEAEMNKVSWTSRKRLAQDTVVVLVTTVAMALFLLAMDLFWGWLLTAVDVLPGKAAKEKPGQVQEARW